MNVEIITQIKELQDEFLCIARSDPWVCLSVPPLENKWPLVAGEMTWPIVLPTPQDIDDTHPETAIMSLLRELPEEELNAFRRARDQQFNENGPHGPPWASLPRNPLSWPLIDHILALNSRAGELLHCVLDLPSDIPADLRNQIKEWERMRLGYGWVRWLWYCSVVRHVNLIVNYPQTAATALFMLRNMCRPVPKGFLDTVISGSEDSIALVEIRGLESTSEREECGAPNPRATFEELKAARQEILKTLGRGNVRLPGKKIAADCGYKYGTLRHHFGPLQEAGLIDHKQRQGYAITERGRSCLPPL